MIRAVGRVVGIVCLATLTLSDAASAGVGPTLDRLAVPTPTGALTVWSRRPEHPRGSVVLVHGRTWSARTAFDFEPRTGSRSLLKALAAAGFAAYAVDLRGYGATARAPGGWLTPRQSVTDVEAVLAFVAGRHPDLAPPVLLGWSRGSKIAALTATLGTASVSALILYALTFDPDAAPLNGPASGEAPAAANSADSARSDFISPDVADPAVVQDFVRTALDTDPIRVDVCCDAEFLAIDPARIRTPTLLIQGARDPGIKPEVAARFFSRLATEDKRWIVIGRADHAAHLETTSTEVASAMVEFIGASLGAAPATATAGNPKWPAGPVQPAH